MAVHTSRTLVGRGSELVDLTELVGLDAERGSGRGAVLLAGDAGVGKTRLLMALRDRAVAAGWRVDAGHCLDFGDSALPYLPFSEVLGRLAEQLPDVVADVTADHPALVRLQPGRRTRDGEAPTGGTDAPAADRVDLFDAVHALVARVAAQSPLLLVIEDLHWADRSTRELLGFLFTRPFDHPVAIVASYRSDDLHRRHPLRGQVAEWARLPDVRRMALSPLADPAVRELVGELAAGVLAESDLADIVRRAEGNAFFVEELVASGGGRWVPDDLADLLLVRLDQLSDEARHVVRVASVAGRNVGHDLLAAAADVPTSQLDAGIRHAVEMNVLVAGSRGYSFRHALLGEAVYDDLLPGERVRLHQQYVAALTSGGSPGTAAELARHARKAMDLDVAVVADIEAGDEAATVGGPGEAAQHYEHALELLTDADRVERLRIDLGKIVVRAGDAIADSGDGGRAAQLLADQLDRLPDDAPARWRVHMLVFYTRLLGYVDTDVDAVPLAQEAVRLAAEEDMMRVKALSGYARTLVETGRPDDAEPVATEALALAERLNLPRLASDLATTLGGLHKGRAEESLRSSVGAAVERARSAGAVGTELRGLFLLGRSHQDAAEWEQAARWFRAGMELGEASGLVWAPYALDARSQLASVRYAAGDWDGVLEVVAVAEDPSAPTVPRAVLATARLAIAAARGDDVLDALRSLREVWHEEGLVAIFATGIEVDVLGRRGDAAGALQVYDDAVAVLRRTWQEHFGARVRLAAETLGALAAAMPTVAAADRGELLERADELRADGEAVVEQHRDPEGRWKVEGRAWEQRLRAEHLRVHWLAGQDPPARAELCAAWEATLAAFATYRHVPELARVRTTYAGMLRQVGDAAAAREHADAARETATALEWKVLLHDLTESGSRPRRQVAGSRHLTPREREILTLVAEGRSNGEVGRQLFISTKTVSVHVSNILGKLGASTRTEAAALARRDGLIG